MRYWLALVSVFILFVSCSTGNKKLYVKLPSGEELQFDSATCTPMSSTNSCQLIGYTSDPDKEKNVVLNITISDLQNPSLQHIEFCKMASSNESDFASTMEGKFSLKKNDKGLVLMFKDVKFSLSDGTYVLNGSQLFENAF